MNRIGKWIAGEWTGWSRAELAWLAFCCGITVAVSLALRDTATGIISSLTGTLYTLFAGKGKIGCYLFGIVNTVLYGWISYRQTLYGEVMLNWGWYLPMMFVGVYCWKRHLDAARTIRKTRLTPRGRWTALALSAIGIVVYAELLRRLGDRRPWLDSTTTVLSVVAMVLTVKRCLEQWLIWIVVNVVSVYMWFLVYTGTGESAASLVMWCVALANGVIFFVQWSRQEDGRCPTE